MKTLQNNVNKDISEQEIDSVSTPYYPAVLSLFLNRESADEYSAFCLLDNPDKVAQLALLRWNAYLDDGAEQLRAEFLAAAWWLVAHVRRIGEDSAGWPHTSEHSRYATRGSWLSSLTQGCVLSVMTRAYQLTNEEFFLNIACRAARTFERDILDGGVCAPTGKDGVFFEEVAVYPAAHTLPGFIFGLLGLRDFEALTGDPSISRVIQRAKETLHSLLCEFDTGYWTRGDLLHRSLATPLQMEQQTILLAELASALDCSCCAVYANRWREYLHHPLSRLRYALAHKGFILKERLLRRVRDSLCPGQAGINPQELPLRVCIPLVEHPSSGGISTFLDRTARIMADRWHIEYLVQQSGVDAGDRVIHRFGKRWMTPWFFPQVWVYAFAGARELFSLLRLGSRFQLVLSQDGAFTAAFAALVGRLTGVRVICVDHSTLSWYKNRSFRAEWLCYLKGKSWPKPVCWLARVLLHAYWPSLYLLARFATSHVDHLLSPGVAGDEIDDVCRELRVPVSRVTRFNITVEPHRQQPVSIEERASIRASMGIPIDALVIAVTVRLDPEKGLDIMLESISRALAVLPVGLQERVRVMIAGDGLLKAWLENEIRRLGLERVCRVMGKIPLEQVHALLSASDISLHTSTRGVGMPAAVLEGMAAGCAVVASTEPLANVRVLARGRGIVVPAGDVERTSAALQRLLSDPELRSRMGQAAREYVLCEHSVEAFRRVLLRATYWSDLDTLLDSETPALIEEISKEQ